MNIEERHEDRREHIIGATKTLILVDGVFSPSVEQIAKKAKVSRTVLNYYFNSKEQLMQEVELFAFGLWKSKMDRLFLKYELLEEHIGSFIDFSFDLASNYPFLELFLSLGKRYDSFIEETTNLSDSLVFSLCEELKVAMEKGKMYVMDPLHTIINLLSITDQPFRILSFQQANDDELRSFSEYFRNEKKQLLMRTLFVSLPY